MSFYIPTKSLTLTLTLTLTDTKIPPKLLTLVIVRDADRVLLGRKKRGFGEGYLNGFGGKVEVG